MKPGHAAAEGEKALDDVLDRLIREGPTERELQKARNLLEADLVKSLKTNHGAGGQLGFFEAIYGSYRAMFSAAARYRAVTAQDCRRVAEDIAFVGGSLEADADVERTVVTCEVMKKDLATGLELFRDAIVSPRFLAEEVERKRDEALAEIASRTNDPATVADVALGP